MKQSIANISILNKLFGWLYRYIKGKRRRYQLKRLARVHPIRLVIGASGICDVGWIETDIEYLNLLNPQHWKTYFQKNSIDAILAEHVWEHLTIDEGLTAAQQCFEYLQSGGYLRVAVPDGFHPNKEYINHVKPGGTGPGADEHKVLYNYITFAEIFEKAHFRVRLLEYFDSEGQFYYTDWNPEEGKIRRSRRFDKRNKEGVPKYTSIILDAYKVLETDAVVDT